MAITTVAQGLSFVQYETDGVQANFPLVFQYLDAADVKVYVDSEEVTYTYLNSAEVTPDVLPLAGTIVTARRFTQSSARKVDFQDGGQLSERLLDLDSNQLFYLTQESQDVSNFGLGVDPLNFTVDARGNRLINVADGIDPTDGINMSQIADLVSAVTTAGAEATQAAADAAASLAAAQDAQAAADAIEGIAQDAEDLVNAHVIDTANPHAVTKAQVGLGNADNTADMDKPLSTLQAAGVAAAIAALVNSSPTTLDTLKELADAIGDDPNFSTTMATALGNRVRVDTAAQGLNGTQKTNAKTNIDLNNVPNVDATNPANIVQTSSYRLVTDAEKTLWGTAAAGAYAVVNKTAAYTLLVTDKVVTADATSAAFTLTLPTAVGNSGISFFIKKTDATYNQITLATTASQTIDGASTRKICTQNESVTIVSNGANWVFLDRSIPTTLPAHTVVFTGWGSISANNILFTRNKDRLEVEGTFTTSSSPTAVEQRVSIPVVTKSTLPTLSSAGVFTASVNLGSIVYSNHVLKEPSVSYMTFGFQANGTAALSKNATTTFLGGSGTTYAIKASIPIEGWDI